MYLVNFYDNWADEIDIHESAIISEKEYQALRKYLRVDELEADEESCEDDTAEHEFFDDFYKCISVGSNEEIEYNGIDGLYSLWEALDFMPITEEEAAVVRKFNFVGYSDIIEGLIEDAMEVLDE